VRNVLLSVAFVFTFYTQFTIYRLFDNINLTTVTKNNETEKTLKADVYSNEQKVYQVFVEMAKTRRDIRGERI